MSPALAPDEKLTFPPVDVLETQGSHLASTQPESGKQREHGEVPPTERGPSVAACKEGGDGGTVERAWQRRKPPSGDLGYGVGERP